MMLTIYYRIAIVFFMYWHDDFQYPEFTAQA